MFRTAASLLSLLLIAAPAAGQSALFNGGFEQGPFIDPGGLGFVRLNPGSTAITSWTVISATIDYNGIYIASEGSRSVDLDGEIGDAGGIQQTFPTVPGQSYRVTFDMAGNPDGGPDLKQLRLSAAGQSADFIFDSAGRTRAAMGWSPRSWTFVANAASATLAFQSLNGSGFGAVVDNVDVAILPPPTITQVNPNTGLQGAKLEVLVTGVSTNWVQGVTAANFGPGVTVLLTTVGSATSLTAAITIDPAAAPGDRTVTVTTGAQVLSLPNGFTVKTGLPPPTITLVNPNTGAKGAKLEVLVTGVSTNWVQGVTAANFGPGVTVLLTTVGSATSLTAAITIDPAAVAGGRTVTVTTGPQVLSLPNGFTVTDPAVGAVTGIVFQLSLASHGGGTPGELVSTPAPNRTVHLYRGQTRAATTTTNAAGQFTFPGLAPGPFQLISLDNVNRIGTASGQVLAGQTTTVNVTIAGAAFVSITVSDIRGNRVAGAAVTLEIVSFPVPNDFLSMFNRSGTADASGFIIFSPVPNGNLIAKATRPGDGRTGRADHYVGPDGIVDIDLRLDVGEAYSNLVSSFNNTFASTLPTGRNEAYSNLVSAFNNTFPLSLPPGRSEAYSNLVSAGNGPQFMPNLLTALPEQELAKMDAAVGAAVHAAASEDAPAVRLMSPADGADLIGGQTIRLAAETAGGTGRVSFLVNGVSFASDDALPSTMLFTVPAHLASLTFRAVAEGGQSSPEVTAWVKPDSGIDVRGRVVDQEGKPVAGARVVLGYNGLRADYYFFDAPLSAMPDVSGREPQLRRAVTALNMRNPEAVFGRDPFGLGTRPDFAARYRGWFLAPVEGEYRFAILAHAGARLILNGETVGEVPVRLQAGAIPIEVLHYESLGPAELQLSVTPPGGARLAIPPSALWAEDEALSAVTDGAGEFLIESVPLSLERVRAVAGIEKDGALWTGASEGTSLTETGQPVAAGTITLRRNE